MSLSTWMRDTITVASQTGVGTAGDPSYGTQRTVKARIVTETAAGPAENPSQTVVYCESELLITDRIWLPGADTTKAAASLRPQSVSRARDKAGGRVLYKAQL